MGLGGDECDDEDGGGGGSEKEGKTKQMHEKRWSYVSPLRRSFGLCALRGRWSVRYV